MPNYFKTPKPGRAAFQVITYAPHEEDGDYEESAVIQLVRDGEVLVELTPEELEQIYQDFLNWLK